MSNSALPEPDDEAAAYLRELVEAQAADGATPRVPTPQDLGGWPWPRDAAKEANRLLAEIPGYEGAKWKAKPVPVAIIPMGKGKRRKTASLLDVADATLTAGLSRHPLSPVIRAWLERPVEIKPFIPKSRASLPRLQRINERLPTFPSGVSAPAQPRQQVLPGFESPVQGCPSWLLWLFDRAGGQSMAQGRGAPWPMGLFVGAMLQLAVERRDGHWYTIRRTTTEVEGWLHPNGWDRHNRRKYWHRFPEALHAMAKRLSYVPVPGVGSVAMLFPSVIPERPTDPLVEFTIRVPRNAAHGARIDWPTLLRYRSHSASMFRAYLTACALLDSRAHKGHGITAEIRAPIIGDDGEPLRKRGVVLRGDELVPHPMQQLAPALTDEDLANLIGFDGTDRRYRKLAVGAWERLSNDGVIDLRREGGGWRLYAPRPGRGNALTLRG